MILKNPRFQGQVILWRWMSPKWLKIRPYSYYRRRINKGGSRVGERGAGRGAERGGVIASSWVSFNIFIYILYFWGFQNNIWSISEAEYEVIRVGIIVTGMKLLVNKLSTYSAVFLSLVHLVKSTVCPEKSEPPNILHWQVQTCLVLNKIKHALAQKYLSYCRQISYNSIIPFNRFSIFTNRCHRFQLPTWLAYYARRHFVDKQNVVKRR